MVKSLTKHYFTQKRKSNKKIYRVMWKGGEVYIYFFERTDVGTDKVEILDTGATL